MRCVTSFSKCGWRRGWSGFVASDRTEGLSETIASGYDLALVRDLAGADPEHAALPSDRVALYRAMLARVQDTQGRMLRLDGLKRLAWTMVLSACAGGGLGGIAGELHLNRIPQRLVNDWRVFARMG